MRQLMIEKTAAGLWPQRRGARDGVGLCLSNSLRCNRRGDNQGFPSSKARIVPVRRQNERPSPHGLWTLWGWVGMFAYDKRQPSCD
ncbi:hypothetical protein C7476_12171 [Phyllobacterium bourgognense]|uniref:Uncharacterized protein n=1 Tax=Phyllobacterium bourgognense TaxID=314236 RepID=A0A368YFF3_9HYPH|nr:hypothetical protein C7476_12171 [Phyllobacterium bourgognense]